MSQLCQRTTTPLEIRRGHIVEHQRTAGEVPFGQTVFDAALTREQPVHSVVQIIRWGRFHLQRFGKTAGRRLWTQSSSCSQFGLGIQNPGCNHGDTQVPIRRARCIEQLRQSQFADRADDRGHMTVRQRADNVEIVAIGGEGFALEHPPQGLDLSRRPIGDIGQGALADLATVTKGFSQQSGRR